METSEDELLSRCLENLERRVKKDLIGEKQFNRKEKIINNLVQNYCHKDLHAFVHNPIFNEYINKISEKLFTSKIISQEE